MTRTDPRRTLSLMVISGQPERLHMALMSATAAAATGRPVLVFAAKSAVTAFKSGGWDALGGAAYDAGLLDKGVADFRVLMDAVKSMDVRFVICDQAMLEHGMTPGDLDPALSASVGGLAGVFEKVPTADWMTF